MSNAARSTIYDFDGEALGVVQFRSHIQHHPMETRLLGVSKSGGFKLSRWAANGPIYITIAGISRKVVGWELAALNAEAR